MEEVLSEVFAQCWAKLLYGSLFVENVYHTGVIGTQFNNEVSLRTVVLRTVDPDKKEIIFYTDHRSPKIGHLSNYPQLSWLFYDPNEKVQIKLLGNVIIHHLDELSNVHWGKVGQKGRRAYQAIPAPSTSVSEPADGLAYLNQNSHHEDGYQNFAVILTEVNYIEWLSLKDTGHRRAQFRLVDNNWQGQWLIP